MKTLLKITLLFLFTSSVFPQPFQFGWITDLHIGSKNADTDLISVVQDINSKKEITFVVATGDITESGKEEDLNAAKKILDGLTVPYFIIPGNHDIKWSTTGGEYFSTLWKDDKFVYKYQNSVLIGLNSAIAWRGGGGHVSPEDLHWLDSVLTATPNSKEILFFAHHQLDKEVDNWYKVTNALAKKNVVEIFAGHGHANRVYNFNGLPGVMSRSALTAKSKSWGYTLVDDEKDSLFFYEVTKDSIYKRWHAVEKKRYDYSAFDSTDFENYSAQIVWKKSLHSTLVAPITVSGSNILAATKKGQIFFFDENGKQLWTADLGAEVLSKPVIVNTVAIVGTMKGDLFTLDLRNGHVIQVIGIDDPITSPISTMEITYEGEKSTALIFGTASGKLFAYELQSLNLLWSNSDASAMIESKPLIQNGKIIFGCWDTYLYCVDAATGLLNWKWNINPVFNYSPAASPLVSDRKNVFFATPDKAITAVDLLLGKTSWRKTDYDAWESIGISNDKKQLYVKSQNDRFYILSALNGKKLQSIDLKFGLDTGPIQPLQIDGTIYFGGKNGIMYAINGDGTFAPQFFMGTARSHSLQGLEDNRIAASNMDGTLVVFQAEQK